MTVEEEKRGRRERKAAGLCRVARLLVGASVLVVALEHTDLAVHLCLFHIDKH